MLDIRGLGPRLLAAVEAELTAAGITLPATIAVVPGGLVAFDGDQLTVNLVGLVPTRDPAAQSGGGPAGGFLSPAQLRQDYAFDIYLLRMVSGFNDQGTPTPEAMIADYDVVGADAEALWAGVVNIWSSHTVTDAGVPFTIGPLDGVGPQGNVCGCRLRVSWPAL